jgi:hypothetical protein
MTGPKRWGTCLAALSLLLCAGCIKVNMDVVVAPDQSSRARLAVAVDTSLAEMSEGEGSFSPLKEAPGKNWTVREYKEDKWSVTEATGHAAPGEALFPDEEDAPKLRVQLAQRRLSTRYYVTLAMPPSPLPAAPAAPAATAGEANGPDLSGLAASMMGDMRLQVSLAGPGEVVATTGEVAGPGKATWQIALTDLQGKGALPDFRLTTELPNWLTIGRLASQIVAIGGPADAGSRLASALQRGLLPNPALAAAGAERLQPADYLRLVEIIGKLDAGAGPLITEAVVEQLRLNDEQTAPARIAATHAKVMKLDIGTTAEQATIRALATALD